MNKLLTVAAAASALVAIPAAAQTYGQPYGQGNGYGQGYGYGQANAGGGIGIQNRIAQLEARLQAGLQTGTITRQEAQSIRPQIRELRRLERQYSANGLTHQERQVLQKRIRYARQQLRTADGAANVPYAHRDQEDGYYGQGGPYENVAPVCEQPRGIGGVISGIFGGGNNNCGLRVGQRASGNLYGLPYEYRNQYRDSGNAYYRTDGRMIYQIDARTNTVVRVYSMER